MRYMKLPYSFMKDFLLSRKLILQLAKQDFAVKYLGSYLGILWAFIQPAIMIAIFWFVFQVGFKSVPVANFPYILWFMSGMIPWFFFTDSVSYATNSVIENNYLVKKILFPVNLLPLVKIVSALFIHVFFIVVLFLLFALYGYYPDVYNLQIFYYLVATIFLVVGISWITSSLIVFLRDVGQVVAMLIQFGFWLTPIFWSIKIIPDKYQFVLKLNPVYYIVEGYRETFIYHQWFWEHGYLTMYFWLVTFLLLIGGVLLFNNLRPHFADVL